MKDRILDIIIGVLGIVFFTVLNGLRFALWVILTALRYPVQWVFGGLTLGGLMAMTVMPLLAYFGGTPAGEQADAGFYVFWIGFGLACLIISPLILVGYDALLFMLQPGDRDVIYFN